MNTKRQTQLWLGLVSLLVVACGQKGPLTLPEPAPSTPQTKSIETASTIDAKKD